MDKPDASIATTDWKACETCLNDDECNGCNVKEKVPLATLYDSETSPKIKKLKVKTS